MFEIRCCHSFVFFFPVRTGYNSKQICQSLLKNILTVAKTTAGCDCHVLSGWLCGCWTFLVCVPFGMTNQNVMFILLFINLVFWTCFSFSLYSPMSDPVLAVPWFSTMVDMPNLFNPLTSAGEVVLDSPLCGELIKEMEELEDISRSFNDDTFDLLHLPDFQESSTSSNSSATLGNYMYNTHPNTAHMSI